MRSPSPADLGYRALGLLPVAAAAAAEGAWVTVVYAAIASFRREAPAIGLWMFIVAAMAGIATARSIRGRASGPARLAVVVLFGLLGSLSDPTTADLLGRGALGVASGGTVGGLLSALAAWRGTRHRDARNDDEVTGSLLAWAVPGLALPWLIGASTDLRPVFVALALPATLLFVAACLVAVGVTRLDTLGRSVGLDWRTNRTWLALLVGVVGSIVVIGTPIAFLLGSSVSAIIAGLLGPLGSFAILADAVLRSVAGSTAGTAPIQPAPTGSLTGPGFEGSPSVAGLIVSLAIAFGLVLGGIFLARRVGVATTEAVEKPPKEERKINLPAITIRLPMPRLPRLGLRRTSTPRSASGAYLAVLRVLDGDERLKRSPAESAPGHARRLREAGRGSFSLDLLAADFELERYAGSELTPAETRRAIRRWREARRPHGAARRPGET